MANPINIDFDIIEVENKRSEKFNADQKRFTIHLLYDVNEITTDLGELFQAIADQMDRLCATVLDGIPDDEKVSFFLKSEHLHNDIVIPMRERQYFNSDLVMNEIMKVGQSKREFIFGGLMEIIIFHVAKPRIGSYNSQAFVNFDRWLLKSPKVVRVRGDGLCLPRSIAVSKAHVDGVSGKSWRQLRKFSSSIQKQHAETLCREAGIEINKLGLTYDCFQKFQNLLTDYQLIILAPPKTFIFKGPNKDKQIFVVTNRGHADSLLSIKCFLKCDYWCKFCCRGLNQMIGHRCTGTCKYCFKPEKCEEIVKIDCKECNRFFMSQVCYQTHKQNKTCEKIKYCHDCKKLYKEKNHKCNMKKCANCRQTVPMSFHECFITPRPLADIEAEDQYQRVFVFYDIETFLSDTNGKYLQHVPNTLCSYTVCDQCWDAEAKDSKKFCQICDADVKNYFGLDCVELFMKYLTEDLNGRLIEFQNRLKLKKRIPIIVIAHYGRGFDTQFITSYLHENNIKINLLMKKGTKIQNLKLKNIRFIDSHNFLAMPLAKLPKSFGVPAISKGYFPHLFNKPSNWDVIRKDLPEIDYYDPKRMDSEAKEKFITWYNANINSGFDFKKEIIKYCAMDVEVLMRSIMTFRNQWKLNFGMDLLARCITLPQAVMEVFTTKYLQPRTLPIIPSNGYDRGRKQSFVANCWLDVIQKSRECEVKREFHIYGYYVDGFIQETREIFEFYGCLFHGCEKCYVSKRDWFLNPFNGKSMAELFEQTMARQKHLKDKGFIVKYVWECDFKKQQKMDKTIMNIIETRLRNLKETDHQPSIVPRDALFGGRTNAIKLYHETRNSQRIHYMDFCSLYPWAQKYCSYPIGQPTVLRDINIEEVQNIKGLVYCMILPPKHLFFPVLPAKINEKLMFTLCGKCAAEMNTECNHSDIERAIIGTWVTPEISKAIERGYKILKVYQALHFNEFSNNLFRPFIDCCVKDKVEASGWPKADMTEEEKHQYISDYKLHEGIDLDYNEIEANEGKRCTAKVCVNCIWGKFGQNGELLSKDELFYEPEKFFNLLENQEINISEAFLLGEHTIHAKYKKKDEFRDECRTSSIVIACFVTGYARLKLLEVLERLGPNCLYHDTDSVIFLAGPGDYIPQTGPFLGQLTNELKTNDEPDAFITQFVSCGPKTYCYCVYYPNSGKSSYVIKAKGISLGKDIEQVINFDSMKNLIGDQILNDQNNKLLVPQTNFVSDKFNNVYYTEFKKTFRFVYDKRMIRNDYTTRAWGYKGI